MQSRFWQQRWADNSIGWHQAKYHPALLKHWKTLPKRSRVLVPLCGKSLDLIWLAEQNLQVYGVELSEAAVEQFFTEHGLNYHSHTQGEYIHYQCIELKIHFIVGDFFKLSETDFPFEVDKHAFDAIYDRAALVALPPEMRSEYAEQCLRFLKSDYQGLLITFAYDQTKMSGPPFSIASDEVKNYYMSAYSCAEEFDLKVEGSQFNRPEFDNFSEVTWLTQHE